MAKYNILLTLFFTLFFFFVSAENQIYEKDKILSLKIQSCKEDKDCTEYNSNKCTEGYCQYDFYCHEKSCIIPNETMKFEVPVNDNHSNKKNDQSIILEACSSEASKKGECFTRLCSSNADCFSNKCINNVCIIEESLPLIECSNSKYNDKITCGKAAFESCEKDDECYYEKCNDNKTCHHLFSKSWDKSIITYFVIIAISIIVIIALAVLLIKRCRKN